MGRSRGMGQRDDAPPHGVGGYPHGVDVDFPDARFAGVLGSRGQDASPVNCSRGRPDLPDETGNHIQYIVDVFLRSEEHTSELQSLMRISYAVFCLKKKKPKI